MEKFKVSKKGKFVSSVLLDDLDRPGKLSFLDDIQDWYESSADAKKFRKMGVERFRVDHLSAIGIDERIIRVWQRFSKIDERLQKLWLDDMISNSFAVRVARLPKEEIDKIMSEGNIVSPLGTNYWVEGDVFKTDFDISGKSRREIAEEYLVAKEWVLYDFRARKARGKGQGNNTKGISEIFGLSDTESKLITSLYNSGTRNLINAYQNGHINSSKTVEILKHGKRGQNALLVELVGSEKAGVSSMRSNSAGKGEDISGSVLATDSDKNGAYFETRIYRNNPKATAKNLRNSFGEDGANELRFIVKYIINMLSGSRKFDDMDMYSQFNYINGISDGEIYDIGDAISESLMTHSEIEEVFGHKKDIVDKCLAIYKKIN